MLVACALATSIAAMAQEQQPPPPNADAQQRGDAPPFDGPPPFGPDGPRPGFRGPGGPGGFGPGPMQQQIKLVEKFDKDGDTRLNLEERKAAREYLAKERAEGRMGRGPGGRPGGPGGPGGFRGPGGPGGPGGFSRRENQQPPEPGEKLTPADVKSHPASPLYDLQTLRTFFLEFESPDWEKEMAELKNTDVEVPAKLTVDGKTYNDVGVHFRGMSSFMMISEGRKRSLNLSMDFVHEKQRLGGYRTLNLLNSNGDPTFLRAVLYNQIAREYIPTPKTNFVRVVINGESWGVYVNVQQFNKDFTEEWYGTKKGARWKAPGSPGGRAGLEYLGEDVAKYKERFEIKSKDDPKSWAALIALCRALNETPAEKLEETLAPILDIDGALKFLALENVFINTDGYWVRSSDFNLYQDEAGRFHILPHDTNETFSLPEGPGMRGGGGEARGVDLDPLVSANDARKPLLSKLLAVPSLRTRYLAYIREIAQKWLDWNKLGPIAQQYQALIAEDVKKDTRKLSSFEAFAKGVTEDTQEEGFRGPHRNLSLKSFVEQRRAYLLTYPEIQKLSSTVVVKQ